MRQYHQSIPRARAGSPRKLERLMATLVLTTDAPIVVGDLFAGAQDPMP